MKTLDTTLETSLVISDQNEIYLSGLRNTIKTMPGIKFIYSAKTIHEIQFFLTNHDVRTLCLDIDFPEIDLKEFIQKITYKYPSLKVLMLSHYLDKKLLQQLFNAGAKGFILKTASKSEFIEALKIVNCGAKYLDIVLRDEDINKEFKHTNYQYLISNKCKEILFLLSHQFTILEIAGHMSLSTKTVEKHRGELIKIIGVKNMAGLAIYAFQSRIHADVNLHKKYSLALQPEQFTNEAS